MKHRVDITVTDSNDPEEKQYTYREIHYIRMAVFSEDKVRECIQSTLAAFFNSYPHKHVKPTFPPINVEIELVER